MTTPSSGILTTVAANSLGETTTLALQAEGFSGFTNTALGGYSSDMVITSQGQAEMNGALIGGGTVGVTVDASQPNNPVSQVTAADNSGKAGDLIVGAQAVVAVTNPGSPSVSIRNELGFVSTITPNPQSGDTTYTSALSKRKATFYGAGVITDAQNPTQQANAVLCTIPFPHTFVSSGVVYCRLEIVLIAKCIVSAGAPAPLLGDCKMQRGNSLWINNNGSIAAQTSSLSGGSLITNPIYNLEEERGSTFSSFGTPTYSNFVTTTVAAGSESLVVMGAPTGGGGALFGTTVVEIFVTAYFN